MNIFNKTAKIAGLAALVIAFALPQASSAQYYTSSTIPPLLPPVTQSCVNITHYLSYGSYDYSTGGDVSKLQNFLSANGYMSNVVSTGYFGSATYAALIRFQAANNISAIGTVGPLTRAKIYSLSCNGGGVIINPGNTNISISSISSSYGQVGSTVTLYGSGFTSNSNIIHFGSGTILNATSYNGTSLSFVVPATLSSCTQYYCLNSIRYVGQGTYPIYVTNAYGTSNQVNFVVTDGNTGNPGGGYGQPVINNVQAPTSLSVGQTGTWTVNAIDPNNQYLTYSVNWGDQNYYGANATGVSAYGTSQASTFTHVYNTAGTYTVTFTVRSSSGLTAQTSSTVQVGTNGGSTCSYQYVNGSYVYICNGSNTGSLSINSISPTQAAIGSTVTIYGTGFTSNNNTIKFGSGAIQNISSYDGRTLTFVVPSYLSPYCASGYACAQYVSQVVNGSYALSVMNSNGTSNQISFNVGYGNSGTNGVTLSSASPSSAPVNTQVTLYGSNFSSNETVHFGSSVINNVYSNGNSLTFYIPSQQSCTYASTGSYSTNCGSYYQGTTPGSYQVYVTDQYGTQQSNVISFQVTGDTTSNGGIILTSVSSNARVGSIVNVYGTGFDSTNNNTVYINGSVVASNVSTLSNGYIQFALPQYAGSQYLYPGSTYTLTVRNSNGNTSNGINFTVGY